MGYRRNPAGPVFTYRAGSAIIRQSVSAAVTATGLIYTFRIDDSVQQAVRFQLKPDGLKLSSSAGTWDGGTLTVPAAESKSFTVNVELPQ